MGYRDPNEALRVENEALHQRLREAEQENEALRNQVTEPATPRESPHMAALPCVVRGWVMGGALALTMPLMMAAMHGGPHHARYASAQAMTLPLPAAVAINVPRVASPGACPFGRPSTPTASPFGMFSQSIERSARVVESQNIAGLAVGRACTVRIAPVRTAEFNCHVDVTCDGVPMLYGAGSTGYAHCDTDGPRPIRAADHERSDIDGDAYLRADLAGGRVLIEDTNAQHQTTRAVLQIDADPVIPVLSVD